MRFPTLLIALLAFAPLGTACAKKAPPTEGAAASAKGADTAAATSSKDPLMQELINVAANCKINVEQGVISQCKESEKRDLIRDFRRGERDKLKALPVLTEALESSDEKLQTVSARLLEGAYRASFGDDVKIGAVDKATAARLLKVLPKLGKRQANQTVAAAVHAAVLAGEQDSLFKTLAELQDKALRTTAYTHVLVHGDASTLQKVVELAADKDTAIVAAALQAARNWKGDNAEMRGKVCALAESKLSDSDAIVAMRSAQILVDCKGPYVDKLLGELDRRNKEKTVTTGLVRSLYELCQKKKAAEPLGSPEQCSRVRTLLEQWIENKDLNSELRAAALFELGVQFPDEKAEKLCTKYAEDPDPRVKTAAKEAIRRVQRKLGKQVVTLGASSAGVAPRGSAAAGASGAPKPIAPKPMTPKPPSPPTPPAP